MLQPIVAGKSGSSLKISSAWLGDHKRKHNMSGHAGLGKQLEFFFIKWHAAHLQRTAYLPTEENLLAQECC